MSSRATADVVRDAKARGGDRSRSGDRGGEKLRAHWGAEQPTQLVRWPVHVRAGLVTRRHDADSHGCESRECNWAVSRSVA